MRRIPMKRQHNAGPEAGAKEDRQKQLAIPAIVGIWLLSLACLAGAWALLR
ncbi:hypothetical protein OG394_29570 [Kribbella sp. NBC_01245]|uniref:hypothetical protein n=1 Tax=Kribbella sp. NBC_01245 TaxID=2903578 RepID=UPI002E2E58AE|nr:hypothetical protein [Kribbella sp. NBC_01245]